jgi:hypothetical protein
MDIQTHKENPQSGTAYWVYYFQDLGTRPLTLDEHERLRAILNKEVEKILNPSK